MIISHKHKFIFVKPKKVAGTSVEVALGKFCDKNDILTPVTDFSDNMDETPYVHEPRNFGNFYNHITPDLIKKRIKPEIWNNYYKFTIVRNPWDYLVSFYLWEKKKQEVYYRYNLTKSLKRLMSNPSYFKYYLFAISHPIMRFFNKEPKITNKDFKYFIENLNSKATNTAYYIDENGNKTLDYYIRYENLVNDYAEVCNKLNIPNEEIPRLKNKVRKGKEHYSFYYDDYLRDLVAKKLEKEIKAFGYTFERKE